MSREDAFDGIKFGLLVARIRRERPPVGRDAIPCAPCRRSFPCCAVAPRFRFILAAVDRVRVLDIVRVLDGKPDGGDVFGFLSAYVPAFLGLHADIDAAICRSSRLGLFHVAVPYAEPQRRAGEDRHSLFRGERVPVFHVGIAVFLYLRLVRLLCGLSRARIPSREGVQRLRNCLLCGV